MLKLAGSEACKGTGWRCTAYTEGARKAPIRDWPRPSPRQQGHGPHVTLLDLGMARVKRGRVLIKDSRERSASTGVTVESVWKRREGRRETEGWRTTRHHKGGVSEDWCWGQLKIERKSERQAASGEYSREGWWHTARGEGKFLCAFTYFSGQGKKIVTRSRCRGNRSNRSRYNLIAYNCDAHSCQRVASCSPVQRQSAVITHYSDWGLF